METKIRLAESDDVPVLRSLIEASVRGLHIRDYTPDQIDRALGAIYGVDTQLIADRTYFVAEIRGAGTIVGCGGWSKRATPYGGDQWKSGEDTIVDPATGAAKIRAFFVHPAWTRRGIGRDILIACERAAQAAGFTRFEVTATRMGVALYAALGYIAQPESTIALGDGVMLPIVQMHKSLSH